MSKNAEKSSFPFKWGFIDELKYRKKYIFHWNRRKQGKGEADFSEGISLEKCFPDDNKRLDSAYSDLLMFFKDAGLQVNGKYKIVTEKIGKTVFESYEIKIQKDLCRIRAGDTEGIRRGIFHLEELLLGMDGPFLTLGNIRKTPWLKSRISRCFHGPIKRPPLNRDELLDRNDYYPEEYLNGLAHEGVNGLWLSSSFKDFTETPDSVSGAVETRLKKLQETVDKCLLYGIKTYLFMIEPSFMKLEDPLLRSHPELGGLTLSSGGEEFGKCFCPHSEMARKYLYESINFIFKNVKDLGGLINISYGERPTTCLSGAQVFGDGKVACPVCKNKKPWEILSSSLSAMEKGMHDANPDAELISWLYIPDSSPEKVSRWVYELAEHVPDKVIMQYNFESGCKEKQLGKERSGGDYWLSCVGPSKRFIKMARNCNAHHAQISAKIQVGSSHELASLPYIPVPGLLYRKYRQMKKLGVTHVMQCWFFGSYPGLMNRAAGKLAFENFKGKGETEFLRELAQPSWNGFSSKVANAWRYFAEAYSNYPLSCMFQYFGPMHDGVVWPLHLKKIYEPLLPTWLLNNGSSQGDLLGECLDNHTVEETIALVQKMIMEWDKGLHIISRLKKHFSGNKGITDEITIIEALKIHFQSAYNILNFYYLREKLYSSKGQHAFNILARMESIVKSEIKQSQSILKLSSADGRLGFHPEAEGYKYSPEKLEIRILQLRELIDSEFKQFRKLLEANEVLPDGLGGLERRKYFCNLSSWEECETFRWKIESGKKGLFLEAAGGPRDIHYLKIFMVNASPLSHPLSIIIRNDSENGRRVRGISVKKSFIENVWNCKINIPYSAFHNNEVSDKLFFNIVNIIKKDDGSLNEFAWIPRKHHTDQWNWTETGLIELGKKN